MSAPLTPDLAPTPGERFSRRRRLARELALQALYQCDLSHDWEWPPERWARFWKQADAFAEGEPGDRDAARTFARELVGGVCEKRGELDRRIQARARNWSIARMNPVDRNVLRLAAYELFYRDDVPPVASVNEGIELAKKFGDKDSGKFVNGILDRLMRDAAEPTPRNDSPEARDEG